MLGTGRGFTLLELLVVLAIMALLVSAIPFAAARMFPRQRLHAASVDLAVALQSVKLAAAEIGTPTSFELVDEGHAWQGSDASSPKEIPSGVAASVQSTSDLPAKAIRFFPDGSSSGGNITLTLSGRSERVLVSPLTGRIALEEST